MATPVDLHRGWWRRLRDGLQGRIRQRVTRLGYAFAFATLVVGVGAFATANNLLFLLLAAMLSTLLVSGFVSRLGLAGLQVDLDLPEHISATAPAMARVRLHNHKAWVPSFSLRLSGSAHSGFAGEMYFPFLAGGAKVDHPVTLTFPRRGQYREDTFVFSTRFPLGFTDRRVTVEVERDVVVYPSIAANARFEELLRSLEGEISSKLQGRGDDFHRIRPYEYNESARHVDWRATAHVGELQVREYVRREQPSVEIVLDLRVSPSQRDWFEEAVDCCAFLAWTFHERRLSFRFRCQLGDLRCPDEVPVYDILRFLALVEPRDRAIPIPLDEDDSVRVVFSSGTVATAAGHRA